jgi:hypothetical protein
MDAVAVDDADTGVDALFAMKAEMSREEWNALFNE